MSFSIAYRAAIPLHSFVGDWRRVGLLQIVKLAPHVRQTSDLLNAAIFTDLIKPGRQI